MNWKQIKISWKQFKINIMNSWDNLWRMIWMLSDEREMILQELSQRNRFSSRKNRNVKF